ncbi:MAG: DEAD/DEAH box helicase, partial [Marinicella sp.]
LYFKKQLPKFVSLADQYVLYQMNQNGLAKVHQFTVNPQRDEAILLMMLKSNRCFWKACYRPPITLHEINQSLPKSAIQLSSNLQLLVSENAANYQIKSVLNTQKLSQTKAFEAHLMVNTSVINLDWHTDPVIQVDVAHPNFSIGEVLFDLNDLITGAVKISSEQLELVASCCYQIEKLNSIFASFEPPISQHFQLNDRYLGDDFIQVAPMLLSLHHAGWQVIIEDDYRLNRAVADQWFVDVNKAKATHNSGWFDVKIGVEINQQKFNLVPYLLKAIKTGAFDSVKNELMIQLDNGLNIGVAKKQLEQIIATISELYDEKGAGEELLLSEHQMLHVAQAQKQWRTALETEQVHLEWLGSKEIQLKAAAMEQIKELEIIPAPVQLNATLRPYQQVGYSWLMFLAKHQFHGLLADDMGLGKTLQTLAFIQAQKNHAKQKMTNLIVAPTSLLGNWAAEAARFTPDLTVGIMTGPNRQAMYQKFADYDLVVTSYGIISRDFVDLNKKHINLLVLDEAQAIKNRKTQVAKIIKRLDANYRLCLSGTPVENHLGELWSIFDFLMPGFLGSEKQFQKSFQWPIERENNQERLQELQARLAPFIMRRTKTEVAKELPEKSEIIKYIQLDEEQASVYESIRLTMADEIRKAVKKQQNNQILIGNALLRLRQVCCHPQLIKLNSINQEAQSAKLNWLLTALPNLVEEGRRILIFSSFTSMLAIIADKLADLGINYFELTGKTPSAKRTEYIDGFQSDQRPVFLISLKAGGAGINLTNADTVIHFDPWWNPAAEQQASDRAHRIGQDKQVFVYKLITRGTVEEKIYQLQQQKQQLAEGMLSQSVDISQILSSHQWEDMLSPISQ